MLRSLYLIALVFATLLFPESTTAQESLVQQVAMASAAFDVAFAAGDFETQESLLTEESVVLSAGGKWMSREDVLAVRRSLLERRPGITFVTVPDSIQVGPDAWGVASERGTWIERWVQDGEQVVA